MPDLFHGRAPVHDRPALAIAIAGILAEHSVTNLVLLHHGVDRTLSPRRTDLPTLLQTLSLPAILRTPDTQLSLTDGTLNWQTTNLALAKAFESLA